MIEKRIQSYIGNIYPSVSLKRHIDLSFIPIGDYYLEEKKKWTKGGFILRITVLSSESQNTYFYTANQMSHFSRQLPYHPSPLVN